MQMQPQPSLSSSFASRHRAKERQRRERKFTRERDQASDPAAPSYVAGSFVADRNRGEVIAVVKGALLEELPPQIPTINTRSVFVDRLRMANRAGETRNLTPIIQSHSGIVVRHAALDSLDSFLFSFSFLLGFLLGWAK